MAFLSEARQTELLSVIVKEKKSLTQRQNVYWLVGRLRDLLIRVGPPSKWEQVSCDSTPVNDRKFNQNFKYEVGLALAYTTFLFQWWFFCILPAETLVYCKMNYYFF